MDDLIRVRDAADMVRLTEQSIRRAINKGSLPVYMLLGLQVVRRADVEARWPGRLTKSA